MSTNKILSHTELQHIEHINKVLENHEELVKRVVNETEALLNNYVPVLSTYIQSMQQMQTAFGEVVSNIIKSSRQLSIVTGSVNDVMLFVGQVQKLNEVLTPELVEKLNRLAKHE